MYRMESVDLLTQLERIQENTKEEQAQLDAVSAMLTIINHLLHKSPFPILLARETELKNRHDQLHKQMTEIFDAIRERIVRETNAFIEEYLDEIMGN